jgi:aldose 1-epimerase
MLSAAGCQNRVEPSPTPGQSNVTASQDAAAAPDGETTEVDVPVDESVAPSDEAETPPEPPAEQEPAMPAEEAARQPATSAEPPVTSAQEPAIAEEEPATPAEQPPAAAQAPADEPPAAAEQPPMSAEQPSQPAETPAAPAETPVTPAEQPATEVTETKMSIQKTSFGKTAEGVEVDLYTCTNTNGVVLKMTNFGATVVALEVPDREGKLANVNLGFSSLDGYLGDQPYFGATVGRCCNRIAGGKFTLDGQEYTLATNNGPNHLHGGNVGFNKVVWTAEPIEDEHGVRIVFSYRSTDGEEGYPGNVDVTATYTLTNDNTLVIDFSATTDKPCPVNLTNHNYWNLNGAGTGTIRDHVLMINADKYLPVDDTLIPTGELADVEGTPLDFTEPKPIGQDLDQIQADPVGYDHCFVLREGEGGDYLTLAARVRDPDTGRVMEVHTTQPGLQFYSGNFLDGSEANGGYQQYEGFCLETQHFPDSPNQPAFPTTILKPGETYKQTTVHRFYTE